MIRTIPQGDLDVNDRITCQNAGLHSTLNTVVDSRDVFLRDSACLLYTSGLMIIPAVFSFSGGDPDTLQAGPALMFITIPKVFESMGLGTVVGILFFTLVLDVYKRQGYSCRLPLLPPW